MSGSVFLDTNIVVYAHDSSAPAKRDRSREIIFACLRDRTGVLSAQVFSEFFVTVTQKVRPPMSPESAKREILLLSAMQTVELDATLVVEAISLHKRWQLSYWDCLIVAAAERADCATVYSEDMSDGQAYGSVTIRNPFR